MPIRINLLAEAQAAAEMRRKDPVKRGIWIGSFLVCVVMMWIGNLEWKIILERHDYNSIEADWKTNMTKYSTVTNEKARILEVDLKLAQLDALATNRFLWAPVLNALQKTMVDNVQFTRLSGDQTYIKEDGRDVVIGGNHHYVPGATIEKVSLSIAAKDLKPSEESYDKYKKSLSTFDFFAKHLQGQGFIMDGILGQLTVDPVDPNKQFVTFTLAAQFPEARHSE
jgi:hypothetical protein